MATGRTIYTAENIESSEMFLSKPRQTQNSRNGYLSHIRHGLTDKTRINIELPSLKVERICLRQGNAARQERTAMITLEQFGACGAQTLLNNFREKVREALVPVLEDNNMAYVMQGDGDFIRPWILASEDGISDAVFFKLADECVFVEEAGGEAGTTKVALARDVFSQDITLSNNVFIISLAPIWVFIPSQAEMKQGMHASINLQVTQMLQIPESLQNDASAELATTVSLAWSPRTLQLLTRFGRRSAAHKQLKSKKPPNLQIQYKNGSTAPPFAASAIEQAASDGEDDEVEDGDLAPSDEEDVEMEHGSEGEEEYGVDDDDDDDDEIQIIGPPKPKKSSDFKELTLRTPASATTGKKRGAPKTVQELEEHAKAQNAKRAKNTKSSLISDAVINYLSEKSASKKDKSPLAIYQYLQQELAGLTMQNKTFLLKLQKLDPKKRASNLTDIAFKRLLNLNKSKIMEKVLENLA